MLMKIKASKASINKIMKYTNDKAIDNDTYNMWSFYCDSTNDKIKEMKKLQTDNSKNSRKYYHIILSPEEQEANIEQLNLYAREFLEKKFEDGQATISIHNDNGRNHIHIVLNAWQLNGIKINLTNKDLKEIKQFAQIELSKKYNFKETEFEKKAKVIKKQIEYHKPISERKFIKQAIEETLKESNTIEDFFETMQKKYNILLNNYTNQFGELEICYKTKKSKYSYNPNQLGEQYSLNEIKKHFEKENKIENQFEETLKTKEDIKAKYQKLQEEQQVINELAEKKAKIELKLKKYDKKIDKTTKTKIYSLINAPNFNLNIANQIIKFLKDLIKQIEENQNKGR